jgi:DNA-binding response OmpR family regulator
MEQVWDEHWHGTTKTLDVHVSVLRRKLLLLDSSCNRITTLRGHGYRYELEATAPVED